MKKLFVACLAVALVATLGAVASVEKLAQDDNPPDYSNDYQVGMAAPGASQVLEDFEGGVPPAGWTVIDNEGTGVAWNTNIFWNLDNRTNGSGICATTDSDEAGVAEFDTELITESYDFCNSTNSGLNAALYYENWAGQDFLNIDVTTDGGGSWTNILSWNEDHGTEDVSLDMSAFDGQPNVQIRFHYFDPQSGDWDWYAQVDDFELTSDGTIVPGVGTCGGTGDGAPTPATSTTGLIILAVLLMIGGSLFVVLRRRTA